MFFLGILVGRDTAPVNFDIQKLERQIAELRREAMKDEQNKLHKVPAEISEPRSMLKFYDALKEKGRGEDPLYSRSPEAKAPSGDKKTAAPQKEKVSSAAASDKPAPSERTKRNVPESSRPSEKILKNYSIQVSASKDPKEADKLVEIYKKKGYPAYRDRAELKDGAVWHRVRIGPYKAYSEAQRVLVSVKKEKSTALILVH